MKSPVTQRRALAMSLALALFLPGCLISTTETSTYDGSKIAPATLEQIKPGRTQATVLGLLGQPTTKTSRKNGTEIFKWTYRQVTEKSGSVFLIFHSKSKTTSTSNVYVTFKDGKVVETWHD